MTTLTTPAEGSRAPRRRFVRQKPNVRQCEGICETCRLPCRGRSDKRFCGDRCRAQAGRRRRHGELEALLTGLDLALEQEDLAGARRILAVWHTVNRGNE